MVLTETACFVELASHNPLAKLDAVSVDELKNTPCILVASKEQEEEEQRFYRDIIGFQREFLVTKVLKMRMAAGFFVRENFFENICCNY